MTSALAVILLIFPVFFFYSAPVEKNRIITIQRPLVITQERKTPAYYLYQQVQNNEAPQAVAPVVTTYLSTQSYVPSEPQIAVAEMKVSRREIASDVDAGFQTAENVPTLAKASLNEAYSIPSATPTNQYQSPSSKWATVRGKFELKDGVGVVDHFIEIKRIEEGRVREVGRVDLNAGLYSIDIENPQGYLVAYITDRNGIRIGEDQQKIVNLQSRGGYFEGPFIRVGNPSTLALNPPVIPPSPGHDRAIARGAPPQKVSSDIKATLFSDQHSLEKPSQQFTNISR